MEAILKFKMAAIEHIRKILPIPVLFYRVLVSKKRWFQNGSKISAKSHKNLHKYVAFDSIHPYLLVSTNIMSKFTNSYSHKNKIIIN